MNNPLKKSPSTENIAIVNWHKIDTVLLDMDGTLTCTEPLFLHGVEAVVRRTTGWHGKADWAGLDSERDYPNIVGFSTLRNLEYLHTLHGDHVKAPLFFDAVDRALVFLCEHDVPQDIHVRVASMLEAYDLTAWWDYGRTPDRDPNVGKAIQEVCVTRFPQVDQTMFSQFGLMVFYADYLDALEKVNRGEEASVSEALFGDPTKPAVAPMPGVALLCALAKGWLPEGAAADVVAAHGRDGGEVDVLATLCRRFAASPVPVALVTSSGRHETGLVLEAVFRAMRAEVATWSLAPADQEHIVAGFARPENYLDAIVTCDDVSDGRMKPFRDPYTMALERLGLDGVAAQRVIGFEDTEAGIIAQRGAGVGVPCAVPIEFTMGQDFSAAAHILPGGVLDAVLGEGLFLG
ncbi:MAG: HAD hydrolase-like protein [Candidatus Hydrogenedentes bacterium]|nr:HAD hydrolase-like protein [Candidatus Hydrogenedentota bacterium]